MLPEEELALVKKGIVLGRTVTGCFEWLEKATRRVKADPEMAPHTPRAIRRLVIEFVASGGIIRQVKEHRSEHDKFEFYYKVILSVPEFPSGLFVEMRLTDADVDCPTVTLVNAHPQRK